MQTFKFRNATYEGQAIDGIPNGRGRLTWDSGVFYEGDFVNGQYHGNGYNLGKYRLGVAKNLRKLIAEGN